MKLHFYPFTMVVILCFVCLVATAGAGAVWQNIQLNSDATLELQNEEQIAVNPANPNNMVCVWRDFRLGYRQVAWGYTFNGGVFWTDGGLFAEPNYGFQSDPGVTTDKQGNFYAVVLSSDGTWGNGLYVFKSTDGGVSWGTPLEVISHVPDTFEDKEFIACDRTDSPHAGNLYVVWNRFILDPASTQIIMARSTDSGLNWSSPVPVSEVTDVHYPIPVVGREGELYMAWSEVTWTDTTIDYSIKIDVSIDGGVTFGTDYIVADVFTSEVLINGGILAYSSPHMDADITDGPFSGRLYVAFMDRRNGYGDNDIWVTVSDDSAASWSTPVRINDDSPDNGRDQFHPWLTVDNTGIVTVVFLDRRHDPNNLTYHCYLTQSVDGGATWSTNDRVSTEPSNPELAVQNSALVQDQPIFSLDAKDPGTPKLAAMAGLIGEYIGVAVWNGIPTPVWTDIRNGHQDVFAGHLEEDIAVLIQRFEATADGEAVHLEWDLASDEGVLGFNIHRRQGRDEYEMIINRNHLIPVAYRSFDDTDIEPGENYYYVLGVVTADGSEIKSPAVAVEGIRYELALFQNYPNPFNPMTMISFTLPVKAHIDVSVYSLEGKLVKTLIDEPLDEGYKEATWDGTDSQGNPVSSGVYFYRLRAGKQVLTKKMVLLR